MDCFTFIGIRTAYSAHILRFMRTLLGWRNEYGLPAYDRLDVTFSAQDTSSVTIEFDNLYGLDWFYLYNDGNQEPEWEQVSNPNISYDTTVLKPERDNAPHISLDPVGAERKKANATWLIDLRNFFDLSYEFKTPLFPQDYFGPNLSLRYTYTQSKEHGVVLIALHEKSSDRNDIPEYEFYVSHYDPGNSESDV